MAQREAKLDLKVLLKAGKEAREKIKNWPKWKREIVGHVSSLFDNGVTKTEIGYTEQQLENLKKGIPEAAGAGTKEYKKFWDGVKKSAKEVEKWPEWMIDKPRLIDELPKPNKLTEADRDRILKEAQEWNKTFDKMRKDIEAPWSSEDERKLQGSLKAQKTLIVGKDTGSMVTKPSIFWRGIELKNTIIENGRSDKEYIYENLEDDFEIKFVKFESYYGGKYHEKFELYYESLIIKSIKIYRNSMEECFEDLDNQLREQAKQYKWLLDNFGG
jgi:hypothetical protein